MKQSIDKVKVLYLLSSQTILHRILTKNFNNYFEAYRHTKNYNKLILLSFIQLEKR